MTRGPDGSFPDEDLANILRSAIESPASAFKARGAPHVLRIIEIMAIEQNRQWGTCSMNEFRKVKRDFGTLSEIFGDICCSSWG